MIKTSSNSAPDFELRDADESDYRFAKKLYVQTMKPLLSEFDAWNEDDNINKFNSYYVMSEVKIIVIDNRDAGWLQVSETSTELELVQIHLENEYTSYGIGSLLIHRLMDEAREKGKSVSLSVVRGNRALSLYERLGFSVFDEDELKLHLRWENN